jgi:oligoribonuclease
MQKLLWCDIETTGLSESRDLILEVGLVGTDSELNIQGTWHGIIGHPRPFLETHLNEVTRTMHTNNGLLADCLCPHALTPNGAYAAIMQWMDQYGFCGRPLAGSNPSFDRRFLKAQMPDVEKRFHYRMFDVNTLHYFFGWDKDKNRKTEHRSLDDIYDDIDMVRRYLRALPDDPHLTDNLP